MTKHELNKDELNAAVCEIAQAQSVAEALREVIQKGEDPTEIIDETYMVHVREALALLFDKAADDASDAPYNLELHIGVTQSFPEYREYVKRLKRNMDSSRVGSVVNG